MKVGVNTSYVNRAYSIIIIKVLGSLLTVGESLESIGVIWAEILDMTAAEAHVNSIAGIL